jgi:peptidoglycan-associated lipoprotein
MIPDRDTFKSNIIYFDFDRSSIRSSERSKLDAVAKVLKSKPETKIQIEGHCDERGTEEYNRALGERRALAARDI